MDQDVERRIRDRAYSIWEAEGRPADRDVDHWLRAAQEIAAEEGRGESGAEAKDAGEGSASSSPATEAGEKPKRARAARSPAKPAVESGSGKSAAKGDEANAETAPKARRSSRTKAG